MSDVQPRNNQFARDMLAANKSRFSDREFHILSRIAERDKYEYRKEYEAADGSLPYLPSFAQRVADKLAAIGLELEAIPANDGTCRKLYALNPLKTDHAAATKAILDGFGFGVYGSADHE
ncbi:hypothetical protein [Aeromonas caviae]|uniref:hypothetical protein n=1 Tax=Aeromonas caviae TaxID=648 RepID=UPI001FFD2865|nr:hypothetical protein [Aeromonas caviae]MCK2070722.1 hypothetical protein [Aeromonas caviae]